MSKGREFQIVGAATEKLLELSQNMYGRDRLKHLGIYFNAIRCEIAASRPVNKNVNTDAVN